MAKISEIVNAWITSINPNEEEKEIAKYRASVCENCEHITELNTSIIARLSPDEALLVKYKCGECGCPLAKKIFSLFKDSCPLKKWEK